MEAHAAPTVQEEELTAQQWFERGFAAADLDEKLRFYTNAIRLRPEYAEPFINRGNAHYSKGDVEGALEGYSEAIRLTPDYAEVFYNRVLACRDKDDVDGAQQDYDEAIRLGYKPRN